LIDLLLDRLGFLLQILEIRIQPADLLFLGQEPPLKMLRSMASTGAGVMMMPPPLAAMVVSVSVSVSVFTSTGCAAHEITSLHIDR
jgi:hypothetical protein